MTTRHLTAVVFAAAVVARAAGPALAWGPGAFPGLGLSKAAPGKQAAAPAWMTRLSSWIEAVSEHQPGHLDMAARLVGFSTEQDLGEVRSDFLNLVALFVVPWLQ